MVELVKEHPNSIGSECFRGNQSMVEADEPFRLDGVQSVQVVILFLFFILILVSLKKVDKKGLPSLLALLKTIPVRL